MDDYALVLNAGSSSLKFCVYVRPDEAGWRLEARGQIEGIGTAPRLSAKDGNDAKFADETLDAGVRDGRAALEVLADWLKGCYGGAHILGVGHRVVHGGAKYAGPVVVTPAVVDELKALVPLAPLHQPYNLAAIEAVAERLPDVPQVACFDTGFHRHQPAVAELVPLPRAIREAGVQRYGFHGLSYEYIASVLPEAAPEIADGRVPMQSPSSAVKPSVLSTLRPGTIDPGVILHLFQGLGLTPKEVETMLYKQSGLLGISGISNDMRDLLASDAPEAKLAVDFFVYQAAKQIGALAAVLGGVDGIVFTAGIGEHSAPIRRRLCEASAWLGVALDKEANRQGGPRISTPGSKVSAWVIPTNEELMIARHTGAMLGIAGQRA